MFHYYLDRGLSSVELLAKSFRTRKWFLPELICPDVIDKIKEFGCDIEYYQVNVDLTCDIPRLNDTNPKILYLIDYFGKEHFIRKSLESEILCSNTVIIRDGVWFPYPFTEVKSNEIWFNSLRKIFRGSMGSSIVSPFRLGNNEVTGVFHHPSMTWREVDIRFRNFYHCKELLQQFQIYSFEPKFPTVFPLRLKNRDKVLESAGLTGKLPGMWSDKYNRSHPFYKELTFIPIDSRFNLDQLTETIQKIKDAI